MPFYSKVRRTWLYTAPAALRRFTFRCTGAKPFRIHPAADLPPCDSAHETARVSHLEPDGRDTGREPIKRRRAGDDIDGPGGFDHLAQGLPNTRPAFLGSRRGTAGVRLCNRKL